jgi:hypothetical protein
MIVVRQITDDPQKPKTEITIDNGDLAALDDAMEKWNFLDVASLLRFSVAILRESKEHVVYVPGENGKKIAFAPAENLLSTAEKKDAVDHDSRTDSDPA